MLREYGGIYLDNDCLAVNDITSLRRHHCVVAKPADEDFIGKYDLPFSIELFKYPHGFFSLVAFIGII